MRTLARLLGDACRAYGNRTFLLYSDVSNDAVRELSYAEFQATVRLWAAFLRGQGVQRGDRVGIISPKSAPQVAALYACWWAGAIAVPICETLGDPEMAFIVRDSEPRLLLVHPSLQPKVAANRGSVPLFAFADLPASGAADDLPAAERAADDVAALIYTSGSTGMPKGVMLSHRNLYVNAASAAEVLRFTEQDRVLSLLPYWHSYALVCEVLMVPLRGGQTAIPKDPRDFRRSIHTYLPTFVLVVPRIAEALMAGIRRRISESPARVRRSYDLAVRNAACLFTDGPRLGGGALRRLAHHAVYDPFVFRRIRTRLGGERLRCLVCGGAPLDLAPQVFFKHLGLPLYQGYGLTESAPIISCNLPERHKLGSSGPLLPWLRPERGGDYTFRDEQGNLGKDLHGELLVKGECVMKGYWRHTDASAKAVVDGWLHTGDMGYVDADGFLFLEGRKGNLIVLAGGEKLHPEHVEDVIKGAGLVSECMVIGECCKNVYALVNVTAELAADLPAADLQERLRRGVQECTRHLALYQRPRDVLLLPEFSVAAGTLTATLKVRRQQVWQQYGDDIRRFLQRNGEAPGSGRASLNRGTVGADGGGQR